MLVSPVQNNAHKLIKFISIKMAKVIDLISAIDANAKEYDVFLEDLLSISDDLPSNVDEVNNLQNAVIAHVNSRLNQSSTRHDGLNILSHILPKCPKDVLSKYAVLWITKASQTLESSQSSQREITLACKVLGSLVTLCKEIPELQKHVSMQTVKQLVIIISNLQTDRKCGATFYLIATFLYHYKEPSERLQTSIRKMILPLIDSDQKSLVQGGANCYTLLARATERSFKPPPTKPTYTGWVYSQALLCNSLHAIMDDLFTGLVELDTVDIWEKLELPNISEDNVIEYYCALERRFGNLCTYLSTMLRGCAGKNAVSPNDVLQVLCRGLAVTPANLRNEDSFKKQMLYFILPKLHISLFTVLNAFIDGFKQELVPFAITILQLYQQTLKWTDKAGENQTTISGGKPFKNVRIAVYKSLTMWLSCLGTLSGIEIVSEDFLPHFLKDITPEKERVLLTVQKTQHLSKRALKRFKDNQYENSACLGSANVATKNPCINAELCGVALKTLENVFFNAGSSFRQSFYKSLHNVIIPLLYDYYLGKHEKNFYEENDECRLRLLRVLKALQLNPHPSTPPPTQYSIEIFGMALKDRSSSVIQEAKLAISEIEKIAHPSAPTLQMPVRNIDEEEGGKQLEIRWTRSEPENQATHENGDAQAESSVWERFREARNESVIADQGQEANNKSSELSKSDSSMANGTSDSIDGPTPSKQQKLGDSGERMDTSEDELVTTPKKDGSSTNQKFKSSACETPMKKDSRAKENLPRSQDNEASYLTLKEIQGNGDSRDGTEEAETNDNEKTTTNTVTNGDVIRDGKVNESTRRVQEGLEDNSDDEAILSLFCDELKDT